ncbi:MAG: hypothetical protein J3R72DRAFT_496717 [Linnemannia gamsii]|nr:MAG: hypothetical protein J3R72DRAFT_496717 [Linnemannia gamsii]
MISVSYGQLERLNLLSKHCKSLKALMMLKMSTGRPNRYYFIPPVEELDAAYGLEGKDRGEDEGDLISLSLTPEFAYRFQFRMLEGCQALEKLRLHMRTVEGHHTLVITEADLYVSGAGGSQDRIVAPRLQKLYMNGHLVFEDQGVMTQILCNMFPSLYRLDAHGWGGGIGVGDFAVLIRSCETNMKIPGEGFAAPLLTKEEAVELRMYRRLSAGINIIEFYGIDYIVLE